MLYCLLGMTTDSKNRVGEIAIPGLGPVALDFGLGLREWCSDGWHRAGACGVRHILAMGDGKVEFIIIDEHALVYNNSAMGYPAYYPVPEVRLDAPVKAVLMDLDGTTVHSESFWIWIIEKTMASLLENPRFELEDADLPFVSGHSVSEHLQYCIRKYCPHKSVEEARRWYFKHTSHKMKEILEGGGRMGAFTPLPGIKDFLCELKHRGIKIGLVTSGLYERAWPEILKPFKPLAWVTRGSSMTPSSPPGMPSARANRVRSVNCRPSCTRGCMRRPRALASGYRLPSGIRSSALRTAGPGSFPSPSPVLPPSASRVEILWKAVPDRCATPALSGSKKFCAS